MTPAFCFAQIFSKADTAKSKEIEKSIIQLVSKAAYNFKDLRKGEFKKERDSVTYNAKPVFKMHAQQYFITHSNATGKSFYISSYTEPHAMNLAIICLGIMTEGNKSNWITTEAFFDDKDLQGAWLNYKGAVVGKITRNAKEKIFTISIGLF